MVLVSGEPIKWDAVFLTDTYIDSRDGRKWFFGTLILVQAIDAVDSYLKGFEWVMR
jgi:hypothetical protein